MREVAVSDSVGEAFFSVQGQGDTSSLGKHANAREQIRVSVETLDRVLADQARLDLIKIDVEGYEMEVLKGGLQVLEKHRPVVYFECIASYVQNRNLLVEHFAELLKPLGYRCSWINPAFPDGPVFGQDSSSCYVICVPPDDRWGLGSELDGSGHLI